MDTNKMREQFESFAREVMGWEDGDFRLGSDEKSYYWGTTGDAWVFWQASREAVVVELPSEDTCRTSTSKEEAAQDAYNHALGECRSVIEAQGLKVAL